MIGQTKLQDYETFIEYFAKEMTRESRAKKIVNRAYARIGVRKFKFNTQVARILSIFQLVGNPSDGFFGKTISMSIKNFWAEVTLTESAKLTLIPHPLCDPTEFGSLADLHGISCKEGYLGGLRLLQVIQQKLPNSFVK